MSTRTDAFPLKTLTRVDPRQIRISGDLILKGEPKETIHRDDPP